MTPPAAFPNRGPGHLARPPRGPRADARVGRGLSRWRERPHDRRGQRFWYTQGFEGRSRNRDTPE
jgi:hypothetical protein